MQQNPPVDLSPWFQTLGDLEPPLDWREFFGNDNLVEVDVGCGRGLFLVTAGAANSDVNYVGVEINYREGRRAAQRLKKRDSQNARVLGGDVKLAFDKYFPPESLAAVHVYFPDPWWKRRHRRRRVFNDEFVDRVHRGLLAGGELHSWTDVGEYFEVIVALMNHDPRFENLPTPEEKTPEHDMDYRTSFERKKRQAGETIYRGRWRKGGRMEDSG